MKKIFRLLLILCCILSTGAVAQEPVKILAIGNSFSEDAVEQNLNELAAAAGFRTLIGNLYIGGCSLERHYGNAAFDIPDYRYRKVMPDNKTVQADKVTLEHALKDEKWDYVSLQQASHFSGLWSTYEPYLHELVKYVHQLAPQAKIVWHQTWAYAKNSDHSGFKNYGRDQKRMYQSIMKCAKRAVKSEKIDIVVPSGTAIQNARTTFIGDNMNRDGYHLNLVYGRYTAACTWLEAIFGVSVVGNSYAPKLMSSELVKAAQLSAHYAVLHPYRVTKVMK
ncbi:MAG: DUF4886 domain-containing protein [Prevotella sp.]|jgi:beta-glucosidase